MLPLALRWFLAGTETPHRIIGRRPWPPKYITERLMLISGSGKNERIMLQDSKGQLHSEGCHDYVLNGGS